MAGKTPALDSFQISKKTGFLPETPPLTSLPIGFKEWNEVAVQLSDLLRNKKLRDAVHRLPSFNCEELSTVDEWRAALVLLSGIFQGYMWQNGEKEVPDKMPSIVCVPFHKVCEKIGTPLVGTYASTVLYNWRLRNPDEAMTMENLLAVINHTGTDDESWFFMIHVVIELEAVPAIEGIWNGFSAVEERNNEMLMHSLEKIQCALRKMEQVFTRMSDGCDPKTFYVNIRPFVAGTNLDAFPNGMIYEGVYGGTPQKFSGGSAAQSTPLKAMDIFLGIQHNTIDVKFLEDMKNYMPEKHRDFLEFASKKSSVRQYIVDGCDEHLITQYNATINALVSFRSKHIAIVARYIVSQTQYTVNESLKHKGTGGTPFMLFLRRVRDDTKEAIIPL